MAQFIPTTPGIGAAFGTGLGSGLQQLAEGKLKQLLEAPQQQNIANILASIGGGQQQTSSPTEAIQGQQQQSPEQSQPVQPRIPGGISPQQLNGLLAQLPVDKQKFVLDAYQKQRDFDTKELAREEKLRTGTRDYNLKLSQEPLKEWRDRAAASKKNIDTYERLIANAEKGNLRAGVQHQLLSTFGLQGWNQNVDTQLAQADMSQLAQGAGSAFNTRRLTNLEVGTYKNSLVTLWNTPEGIVAISKNRILEDKANIAKYDARRKYLKEHKGELSQDWEDEAEDMYAGAELKKLSQEALDNVKNADKKAKNSEASSAPGKPATSPNSSGASSVNNRSGEGRGLLQQATDTLEGGALSSGARLLERGLGAVGDLIGPAQNILSEATGLPKLIPGREEFREAGKKLFGDTFEPKSKGEEFVSNVLEDAVSFVLPGAGQVGIFKSLAKSLAGESAAKLTEALGGGGLAQSAAKMGVSLLAGTAGTRSKLVDAEKKSYQLANELANGKETSGKIANSAAGKIYSEVKGAPVAKFVRDIADDVIDVTSKSKVPIQRLWDTKRNLGKYLSDKGTPKDALPYIKRLIGSLNESIQKSGHKDFLDAFNAAEDIHTGLKAQSDVTKFLSGILSTKTLKNPLLYFAAGTPLYHLGPPGAAVIGAGAAGITGARELSKTIDLIRKSDVAAKAYTDIFKYSLARDATNSARAVKRYLKIAEREEG